MSATYPKIIDGPAGALEIAFHLPSNDTPKGLALICHPHPQFGGTMDNKVVQSLHKAFAELGFATMRFNFRGVGASEGVYDNGIGETEDAAAALVWARAQVGDSIALVAAGFSFGCFVQTQLLPRSQPKMLVLIAPAVSRFAIPEVAKDTIVIHGDEDDVVPLADVFAWARPQGLPVTVFPGTGHFFHGRLMELKAAVKRVVHFEAV